MADEALNPHQDLGLVSSVGIGHPVVMRHLNLLPWSEFRAASERVQWANLRHLVSSRVRPTVSHADLLMLTHFVMPAGATASWNRRLDAPVVRCCPVSWPCNSE
jgi:hypothetical protein